MKLLIQVPVSSEARYVAILIVLWYLGLHWYKSSGKHYLRRGYANLVRQQSTIS